jgi:hypothetical protein
METSSLIRTSDDGLLAIGTGVRDATGSTVAVEELAVGHKAMVCPLTH